MRFFHLCILTLFLLFSYNAFTKTIDEQFSEAESLIDIDQTKEALALLKTIEPTNEKQTAKQYYLLGRLYYALGKFGKADEFYMDANLEDPTEPKYQVGLSQTSFALGKLKLSERYATSALRDDPDLIEAELMLAMILSHTGKKQEAEKKFLDLIKVQQTNKPLLLTYAKFLEELDLRQKAISTLEDFLMKNPNSPDILDYLGRLYWFDGQLELAIEKREAAAKLYQKNGKFVMTQSITEWVNSVKEKLDVEKKKEEERKKKLLPQKAEPQFTPNPNNEIEPFPDIIYEHARSTGSGFIINDGYQIVTNRHVVEGAYKIFVRNGFGELRFATIAKMSEYDDLALLTLDTPYDPLYSLSIPEDYKLRTGQSALVMGFPLASSIGDTAPSFTQGIVSKTTGLRDNVGKFIITSKLNPGNSGGPIFSDTGELIGVAVAKLNSLLFVKGDAKTDFIPEDVNVAIKVERVKRFIQSSDPVVDLPKLDLVDLYDLKLPSVVMIVSLKPKEEVVEENNEENELEEAIKECQSHYDSIENPTITRRQFNALCECYVNGLAGIYDQEEANSQSKFNKKSDKFSREEEELMRYCESKI